MSSCASWTQSSPSRASWPVAIPFGRRAW
jgi:hypothetical protein